MCEMAIAYENSNTQIQTSWKFYKFARKMLKIDHFPTNFAPNSATAPQREFFTTEVNVHVEHFSKFLIYVEGRGHSHW